MTSTGETKPCKYCLQPMAAEARKCATCREWQDKGLFIIDRPQDHVFAAVLSAIIPGLGQYYNGSALLGLVVFITLPLALVLMWPVGLAIYFGAIAHAFGVRVKWL